jgi:predicted transcriptional regulator
MQSFELDDADQRLLRALQRDAPMSQADLAEQAGVSPSLVSRRLARLKRRAFCAPSSACGSEERGPHVLCDHSRAPARSLAANVRAFRDLLTRMVKLRSA